MGSDPTRRDTALRPGSLFRLSGLARRATPAWWRSDRDRSYLDCSAVAEPRLHDGPPETTPDARARWVRVHLDRAFSRLLPRELTSSRVDLIQTAVVRILEHERREKEPVRTASYVWRVAFTIIADELRRRRRAPEDATEEAQLELEAQVHPPSAVLPGLGEALRACLALLAEARRRAVLLHLQGFRAFEAAELLRTSEKRAQNLTYRGLADLRQCLVGKGHGP